MAEMSHNKAIKIAISAMQEKKRKYAVDKNLHDVYKADYPHAINASLLWHELDEAILLLADELKNEHIQSK